MVRFNFKNLGYSNDLQRIPKDGDPEYVMQVRRGIEEMPRYKIAACGERFYLLLSLFDLIQDVSLKAQELTKMLVTNPILLDKILHFEKHDSEFSWSDLLSQENTHKLLYSLEIIEAILVRDLPDMSTKAWTRAFVES